MQFVREEHPVYKRGKVELAEGRAQESFEADVERRTAERLPIAGLAFAVVIGLAWIFEHRSFPERDRIYAIFYSLELVLIGTTVWAIRRRPQFRGATVLASVCTVGLVTLVTGYHIVVESTGDVLALALLYILVGTMVAIPWGWRWQIPVSLAAVIGFLATISLGAQPLIPVAMHVLGLSTMALLTILGAWFLERQRWALFQQARELQRSNAALVQANRELERANRIKNEFLASVSHELRTPLNIIMGYVDLLGEGAFGPLPSEAAGVVERLSRTARNLVFLVSDLLDLSRIEAGRLTVQLTAVELEPVFQEVQEYVIPRLENKPVAFLCEPPADLAVVADRNRLQQILLNLLSNATKFTDEGYVRLYTATSADGYVDVHVEDTGVGIAEQDLPSLFEAFRQSQAGRDAGGVGIGLAISKRLATAMGGDILVETQLHKGSRFTLRLKRAQ